VEIVGGQLANDPNFDSRGGAALYAAPNLKGTAVPTVGIESKRSASGLILAHFPPGRACAALGAPSETTLIPK
jgi:hypothetical protein